MEEAEYDHLSLFFLREGQTPFLPSRPLQNQAGNASACSNAHAHTQREPCCRTRHHLPRREILPGYLQLPGSQLSWTAQKLMSPPPLCNGHVYAISPEKSLSPAAAFATRRSLASADGEKREMGGLCSFFYPNAHGIKYLFIHSIYRTGIRPRHFKNPHCQLRTFLKTNEPIKPSEPSLRTN